MVVGVIRSGKVELEKTTLVVSEGGRGEALQQSANTQMHLSPHPLYVDYCMLCVEPTLASLLLIVLQIWRVAVTMLLSVDNYAARQ